jgi:hypothetical protein
MKWYPSDWRSDAKLRLVSFAARGLWVDILSLMHESEQYGYLLVAGKSPSVKNLSMLLGGDAKEISRLLGELSDFGVYSVTDQGVIYSRRMVRDKAKSEDDRVNGKRGGNPKLRKTDKGGVNPPVKPLDKGVDKAQKLEARDSEAKASAPDGALPVDDKIKTSLPTASIQKLELKPDDPDLSTVIFRQGVNFLVKASGKSDDKIRSILGKWRNSYGDELLVATLGAAQREHKIQALLEPVGWIEKALQSRGRIKDKAEVRAENIKKTSGSVL